MKATTGARILFGASAVLFGVITVMWHDADAWQGLPFLKLPFGAFVADALAIAQIVAGAGLLFSRTARTASVVLFAVYVLFDLACIPGIVAHPNTYAPYVGFFEWFSLVNGAIAAYAATQVNAARFASFANAARVGLGISTISFTLAQIFYFRFTASLVPTWILPNQPFWAAFTTVAFGLAAIAMLIDRFASLAIRLMTVMLALFGLLVWVPALITAPKQHGNWSEFALNFLITGASWLVGRATEQRDALRRQPGVSARVATVER